ncbi:MAG: aldo/keto reductase [Cellvibrionales bacterium]|jgi:myo-inositol catabolism protein IolS|nr:aldo/keto reductase [Cellvibrionales bacterium]TXH49454.1 MAG: aldo/keto reductase [Cellvibrionales bacterium]HRF87191.1 aldo/keto reductase [Pseudomonadales bacterium]HRG49529.1 aldo/keto reductase [Pseudomonadales bacterium]
MQYRRLGKTSLQVSAVGIGTWQLGNHWGKSFNQPEVNDIFAKGAELGINLVDTAECYGHHVSEAFIGEALKNTRGHWIIATKFGHHRASDAPPETHWQPESVLQQLEASLRALQTDYIDIYQFHSGTREQLDNDALWTMLNKQVQAGKIRHLGISIGQPNQLYQVERATALGVSVIQTIYNAINSKAADAVLPSCLRQDLGVLARVPLASGFLSGKYQPDAKFPDNDVRADRKPEVNAQQIAQALQVLQQVPTGVDPASWACSWCLQHPAISSVIPGIKSIEQLVINAAGADL